MLQYANFLGELESDGLLQDDVPSDSLPASMERPSSSQTEAIVNQPTESAAAADELNDNNESTSSQSGWFEAQKAPTLFPKFRHLPNIDRAL